MNYVIGPRLANGAQGHDGDTGSNRSVWAFRHTQNGPVVTGVPPGESFHQMDDGGYIRPEFSSEFKKVHVEFVDLEPDWMSDPGNFGE